MGTEFATDRVNFSRFAELRSNNKVHASLSNNRCDYIFIKDRPSNKVYRCVIESI